MESVGFKEWALVCAALGAGEQTILLRKGGIAEGRAGFQFRHRAFFLFPTFFHEQLERTRLTNPVLPTPLPDEIEIRFFARIEETQTLLDWKKVQALAPLHILQESVVRERFHYGDASGVEVAFLRVFRLEKAWRFPGEPRYGGCRSWVNLPAPPADLQRTPVLAAPEHKVRRAKFNHAISSSRAE